MIFALLRHVQVDCVIVRRELVTFEELDSGLIQLQHNNLVKQFKALDVALSVAYAIR